jgi:CPA1 family monovalent cation:H+ antiporter
MDSYTALRGEALLSDELFEEIQRDVEARRDAIPRPVVLDLRTALRLRLQAFAQFGGLPEAELDGIARQTAIRFVLPGERIQRHAGAGYLISSGEVEIEDAGKRVRLAQGAQFGGKGLPGAAKGAATAMRYCLLLVLPDRVFRSLSAPLPERAPGSAMVTSGLQA